MVREIFQEISELPQRHIGSSNALAIALLRDENKLWESVAFGCENQSWPTKSVLRFICRQPQCPLRTARSAVANVVGAQIGVSVEQVNVL
jgi:hypothetical protein